MKYLSVVIISKNEDGNIARCIESVIEATKDISDSEIILVDSASTDKTIEIAMKYPIKIIQLCPSWPLSPGAGFYIGFYHTKGKYIQFYCGDSILDKQWLRNGLQVLEKNSQLAGVGGVVTQELYDTRFARAYVNYLKNLPVGETANLAGETLFKRDILLKVGTFNPYLKAGEEGELCFRVIDSGYKLLRLPFHMSHHVGCHTETFLSYLKKMNRYTIAQGQILRYSVDCKRIFIWRLKEYKFKLISTFLILFGLLSFLVFMISNNILPFYILLGGILLYFGLVFYEIRTIKGATNLGISQMLKSVPFVWGFLQPKREPEAYPKNVIVLKE